MELVVILEFLRFKWASLRLSGIVKVLSGHCHEVIISRMRFGRVTRILQTAQGVHLSELIFTRLVVLLRFSSIWLLSFDS